MKDIHIKKKKVKSSSDDLINGAPKFNSSGELSQKYLNANYDK